MAPGSRRQHVKSMEDVGGIINHVERMDLELHIGGDASDDNNVNGNGGVINGGFMRNDINVNQNRDVIEQQNGGVCAG